MKTILTTAFAIAVMVIGFSETSAIAGDLEERYKNTYEGDWCRGVYNTSTKECKSYSEIDRLNDPDSSGKPEVADSGNEGSTSAASAGDE